MTSPLCRPFLASLLLGLTCFGSAAFAQNTFPGSGNVGVGTTSPVSPLQVNGNNGRGQISVTNSSYTSAVAGLGVEGIAGQMMGGTAVGDFLVWGGTPSSGKMIFSANGLSQHIVLTNGGAIGVGWAPASAAFHLTNNIRYTGAYLSGIRDSADVRPDAGTMGYGLSVDGTVEATNGLSNAAGVWIDYSIGNSGSVTNTYGLFIGGNPYGSAVRNYSYGIRMGDITGATSGNYAIQTGLGTVAFGDKVGIGTATPSRKLHLVETNSARDLNLALDHEGTSGKHWLLQSKADGRFVIQGQSGGSSGAPGEALTISTAGNVGIRTTGAPDSPLTVKGRIHATEVVVDTAVTTNDVKIRPQAWADDVFDESHTLAPLSQVERQIKQDKHLPGIPSAREVAANGISVGDMQARLLAKIEELTLRQIEQEKQMRAQGALLATQAERLSHLEAENAVLRRNVR